MAYDLKKYALAVDMLGAELGQSYNVEKQLLLADALAKIDKVDLSVAAYQKGLDATTPPRYLIDYAQVLKRAERYDEAIDIYKMLMTEVSLDALLNREISYCQTGKEWKASPDTLVEIIPLDQNSKASDYAPAIIDGHLVFTSDRFPGGESAVYDWTGFAYSNLWVSNLNGEAPRLMQGGLNTTNNEGSAVLTPDGNYLFFTRCVSFDREDAYCRLMVSERERGGWSKAKVVEGLNGNFNAMHPAFSSDGQLMFFSSDAEGGYGQKDLYYVSRTENGWGTARNLGQIINTAGNEIFPYVYNDTLFFSSDGLGGMGGLDLYYTYFDDEGRWVHPNNMKTPYNSGADDFGLVMDTLNRVSGIRYKGYFSSSRKGGEGQDDIYSFVHRYPVDKKTPESNPLLLTIKVVKPIYRESKKPSSGIRRFVPVEGAKVAVNESVTTTDLTGVIVMDIDSLNVYSIVASAEGHLANSAEYQFDVGDKNEGYVRLVLHPIIYNTEIIINNIYYDFEKWAIREDARPALDSLASILTSNPDVNIQLSSHTDCRGDEAFNLDLSQKRANSVTEYLISAGIDGTRLTAVGYGESKPISSCECLACSEDEHQLNRRTAFTILKE
jgi:outer membrane protein OmpA-like peptidoglycan-associated protein